MNADFQDFKYNELTEKIIKNIYRVYTGVKPKVRCKDFNNSEKQSIRVHLRKSASNKIIMLFSFP